MSIDSPVDGVDAAYTAWRESKRFVLGDAAISSPQPLPRGAGPSAGSRSTGRRAALRAGPGAPGRWQRLLGFLRATAARWRTPVRRGR